VECAGIGLIGLIVGVFMLIMAVSKLQQNAERWNRSFVVVAQRFGGQLTRGGWFRNPSLRMVYGHTYGRLAVSRLGGSNAWVVEMVVQMTDLRLNADIAPRHPNSRLLGPPATARMQEIPFDWNDFQHPWRIVTDTGDELRLLLTRVVRMQLDQLPRYPIRGETAIRLMPSWLIVRKIWDSHRPNELEALVEAVFSLYDQLQLARSAGIEFVETSAPVIVEDAKCCICGETMQRDIVLCRRCKTPHHRECWEYAGQCSTYGCREVHYELAAIPAIFQDAPQPTVKPAKPR
jgi:hypothetical protein